MTTIRTILSIIVVKNMYLEHKDVKTTFLHGNMDKEMYMKQPRGYVILGKKVMVCRLKKSLYG